MIIDLTFMAIPQGVSSYVLEIQVGSYPFDGTNPE